MDPAADHNIILADTDGVIRHRNTYVEYLFARSAVEAAGKALDCIIPEEDKGRHWNVLHRLVESSLIKLDRAALDVTVRRNDGTSAAHPVRCTFLRGPRDSVAGWTAVFSKPHGHEQPLGETRPL